MTPPDHANMLVIYPVDNGEYRLEARQDVPRPIEEVFAFFSDAFNLARLTPPWLKFTVLTEPPIDLKAGTLIDYKLRVRGIPIRWQSEISAWEPPRRFVDEQRRGPYRRWHHEHLFEPTDDGTRVRDTVTYKPLGGRLANALFVARDLRKIFHYRAETLRELFGN